MKESGRKGEKWARREKGKRRKDSRKESFVDYKNRCQCH